MKRKLAATVVLGVLVAGSVSACTSQPVASLRPGPEAGSAAFGGPRQGGPVGGYEGWWNATPANGDDAGLPDETVAVDTRTNTVVDAFNRAINASGQPTRVTDVDYTVTPNPEWPRNSVVIIDTSTNRVIADFRVDAEGTPLR